MARLPRPRRWIPTARISWWWAPPSSARRRTARIARRFGISPQRDPFPCTSRCPSTRRVARGSTARSRVVSPPGTSIPWGPRRDGRRRSSDRPAATAPPRPRASPRITWTTTSARRCRRPASRRATTTTPSAPPPRSRRSDSTPPPPRPTASRAAEASSPAPCPRISSSPSQTPRRNVSSDAWVGAPAKASVENTPAAQVPSPTTETTTAIAATPKTMPSPPRSPTTSAGSSSFRRRTSTASATIPSKAPRSFESSRTRDDALATRTRAGWAPRDPHAAKHSAWASSRRTIRRRTRIEADAATRWGTRTRSTIRNLPTTNSIEVYARTRARAAPSRVSSATASARTIVGEWARPGCPDETPVREPRFADSRSRGIRSLRRVGILHRRFLGRSRGDTSSPRARRNPRRESKSWVARRRPPRRPRRPSAGLRLRPRRMPRDDDSSTSPRTSSRRTVLRSRRWRANVSAGMPSLPSYSGGRDRRITRGDWRARRRRLRRARGTPRRGPRLARRRNRPRRDRDRSTPTSARGCWERRRWRRPRRARGKTRGRSRRRRRRARLARFLPRRRGSRRGNRWTCAPSPRGTDRAFARRSRARSRADPETRTRTAAARWN